MYIFKKVSECDFSGEKFATQQDGVAVIAQGATGRWCEVLHGGKSALEDVLAKGATVYTAEQAREIVDSKENSWAEF